MKPMTRMILALALLISSFRLDAVQPVHNYSDKSVSELLELIESKDENVRSCAAIFLGERYKNPHDIYINAPISKINAVTPELPIPPTVLPKLTEHLKSDASRDVRISSLLALAQLRFQTNTTSILVLGLNDSDSIIRIRACSALIGVSQKYSEQLPKQVIPTLLQCLDPKGDVEIIWQAAYATEELGKDGQPFVPALQQLRKHQSKKVRDYANRALAKIDSPK